MIAQILPSLDLPTNIKIDTFSYIIPKAIEDVIKIGQMVEINFRNKKIQGIVIEIIPEHNLEQETKKQLELGKIKEINKIIQSEITITQTQLDIINFISENYYVSKAKSLKTVIPELPKRQV